MAKEAPERTGIAVGLKGQKGHVRLTSWRISARPALPRRARSQTMDIGADRELFFFQCIQKTTPRVVKPKYCNTSYLSALKRLMELQQSLEPEGPPFETDRLRSCT